MRPFKYSLLILVFFSLNGFSQSIIKDTTKYSDSINVSKRDCLDSFVRIHLSFVVNEEGEITKIKVFKVENKGYDKKTVKNLKSESIRIITNMPNFKPRIEEGKPIKVKYTLPIKYCIEDIKERNNSN